MPTPHIGAPDIVVADGARTTAQAAPQASRISARLALAAVCVLAIALTAGSIRDESAVSLDGDMPHYLMNGVFVLDVIRHLPLRAPLEYAQLYYARYPALTLGHHPFFPAVAEAPFFLLFGVSVFSARLTTLVALGVMVIAGFRLIRELYDTETAIFSSLLFLSTPWVVPLFQVVLSEPFTLCLITLSVYLMHRYTRTARLGDAVAFTVATVLSVYAKHLAVFMFPVYAFQFVRAFGWRQVFTWRTIWMAAAIGVCILPLVPLTLKYSHFNVLIVSDFSRGNRVSGQMRYWLARFWSGSFRVSTPLLAIALVSTIGAALRRDRRAILFVVWIGAIYGSLVGLGVENDRFLCYWLLPFCVLGAAVYQLSPHWSWRALCVCVLGATIVYQTWLGVHKVGVLAKGTVGPAGAGGYEDAARYVVQAPRGDAVLYSAAVDTGYFVFFVRKHDPDERMIVLRSDKMLTTSRMGTADFERRISKREEILPLLRHFGVGYVVLESGLYPDGPLSWLQDVVRGSEFELRRSIPIRSSDRRLDNAALSVYELKGATRADPDASLAISVPLMDDRIEVPFRVLSRQGF